MESHQDQYKLWHNLSLIQQLNYMCDTLAKRAVSNSLNPDIQRPTRQLLPRESAAVIIDGIKQASDVSRDARFALGVSDAEKFYCAPVIQKDIRG